MKSLFDDFFSTTVVSNIEEQKKTEDGWEITLILPGVKKEDLLIELAGNKLDVSWTRDGSVSLLNKKGSRAWKLPAGTKVEHVSATCKLGVLKLFIKEKEEMKPQTHRIPVK